MNNFKAGKKSSANVLTWGTRPGIRGQMYGRGVPRLGIRRQMYGHGVPRLGIC
ncbi:MAG: hypothetical protein HDS12_02985 [Bacteroides sp.]|nr:hypothetical protein [Bacteroides sp.]